MAEDVDNVAQRTLDAQRLQKALKMRVRGAHWGEIADRCGYPSPAAALRDVGEAMEAATQRADESADQMRDTANLQFDALMAEAWDMLEAEAPETYDRDGNPTGPADDRAVRLRAVDEIRRLVESRLKLNGVTAKPEDDGDGFQTIRIVMEG